MGKHHDKADLQLAVDADQWAGRNLQRGATITGVTRSTFQARIATAKREGYKPRKLIPAKEIRPLVDAVCRLTDEAGKMRTELQASERDALTRAEIRRAIFGLKDAEVKSPSWLLSTTAGVTHGVPTIFASDWHWGEVVSPSEIGGANEYNLTIAHTRARKLISKATSLLKKHLVKPNYPGVVFALGGDLVSGDIHEELERTNEKPLLPIVLDLVGALVWCISTLADNFGLVFVPAVTGNHGRKTRKPQAKQRAQHNFDWLVYQILRLHFADDKRVVFSVPDGPDVYWNVYGHRYAMTHGDQFRGGDGITGALMPIIRGRHKKSSRDVSLNQPWDTLIMGHWHTLIQLPHVVVNGSLKGYDEYAFGPLNASFERAAQALWITHPEEGITWQAPVYVDEHKREGSARAPWVNVFK